VTDNDDDIALPFTPQLREWALHNIDRGIPPEPLARAMAGQGFDERVAAALAGTFWAARSRGDAIPENGFSAAQVARAVYRHAPQRLNLAQQAMAGERRVRVAARLAQPAVTLLDDVLAPDECKQLIALARPRLAPSTIVDPASGMNTVSASRTSEGMFFRLEENPLVARIDRRVSQLMNLPVENGEGLQVLRYPAGAESMPHYDFLKPSNAHNRASLARSGQRVATMVIYLNDVAQGGETVFPEAGLAVAPRKGSAVYFEYCNGTGQLDPLSLHAGAAPAGGEKWIVTKWMRQRRFVPGAA
jgi:prolyl 4-hydroxylase